MSTIEMGLVVSGTLVACSAFMAYIVFGLRLNQHR
jgi:hypothetical protein